MNYADLKQNSFFIEASTFDFYGGWVLDTQYIQTMGSSFLLAHGIGEPVENAVTKATFPQEGDYRMWVFTRNWVAPWKKDYAPGTFSVSINGMKCNTVFGTESENWAWQYGGIIHIDKTDVTVEISDLTGYEGRFAAIFFTMEIDFVPPDDILNLELLRRTLCGKLVVKDGGEYDMIVVGGGFAGMACAKMAAQHGLQVALVQDRFILGGNNSSEIRVWLYGKVCFDRFPNLGKIVKNFDQKVSFINGVENRAENYEDERKLKLFEDDKNIRLFMGYSLKKVECEQNQIKAVVIYDVKKCDYVRISAPYFSDCTGDGTLGYLSGADYEITPYGHMEQSNFWCVDDMKTPQDFEPCPWALDLHDVNFVSRPSFRGRVMNEEKEAAKNLGNWQWGSGFEMDPIKNDEKIRDYNFRAMYGAWDAIKNTDHDMKNYKIVYSSYLSGKRESRRLLGDVVLTTADIINHVPYKDGIVGIDFNLDTHRPDYNYYPAYREGYAFIGKCANESFEAPYYMPYRCLYSRNIKNLFMAGRDISVTHDALGPVRIIRTCGLMGEVVGYAAALCKKHGCNPRVVYENHLDELMSYMEEQF